MIWDKNSSKGSGRATHARGRGRGRSNSQQRKSYYGGNCVNFSPSSYCGKSNHEKNCWYKNRTRQNNNTSQCYNCNKYGHFVKNYYPKAKDQANFYEENDEHGDQLLFSCLAASTNVSEDIWNFDSGCGNQMTGNKNLFVEINESVQDFSKDGR